MLVAILLGAQTALAGGIKLDAEVHEHKAQVVLDDAAACAEHELSFENDDGSWKIRIEGGAMEGDEVWLRVEVDHRWTEGKEVRKVRVRPTFIVADGEVASITVGEGVRLEVRATGLQRDGLSCMPRDLDHARSEGRREVRRRTHTTRPTQ